MSLSRRDALAILSGANKLQVDPGAFAGLMELESGINPNIGVELEVNIAA